MTGLLAGLTLATSACAGAASPRQSRTVLVGGEKVAVGRFEDALSGLCLARHQAPADTVAARATFLDRSHATIHTLARALADSDRSRAASLLQDKEAVEADFAAKPPSPSLATDLGRLIEDTRSGMKSLSVESRPCSKDGKS